MATAVGVAVELGLGYTTGSVEASRRKPCDIHAQRIAAATDNAARTTPILPSVSVVGSTTVTVVGGRVVTVAPVAMVRAVTAVTVMPANAASAPGTSAADWMADWMAAKKDAGVAVARVA